MNVLGYYEPLRELIRNAVAAGFIQSDSSSLITFIDEPADGDWGRAALQVLESWEKPDGPGYYRFDWSAKKSPEGGRGSPLGAS